VEEVSCEEVAPRQSHG